MTRFNIQDCLQNEPAFCMAACPFHLDVREFVAKLQRGSFTAAYRQYSNATGFPAIVAELCDASCKTVCARAELGGSIEMRLLESAAICYTRSTQPNSYNVPAKSQRVAVIGGGISGLACALRLAERKYPVTVYERSGRIGGQLWDLLPPDVFLKEIEKQFQFEQYTLRLETEVSRLDSLDYDAIYVATGAGGSDFGLARASEGAFASTTSGVFLGGVLTGASCVQSIADGLNAAGAVERYLKSGGMNHPRAVRTTRLQLDLGKTATSEVVRPQNGSAYTQEEAQREAERCLRCACDACMRACDLMQYFQKYPKRIAEEVEITIHPGTIDGDGTVATRFISTCNQCGLCKEVCPVGIDTGAFLLESHRIMREKDAMPWAFHDFWLRDMAFSNGEAAGLFRSPRGVDLCRYLFFPGCQLGASDPRYVLESYRWLREKLPDTALGLGCCGAPAEWAGDRSLLRGVTDTIRAEWLRLGRPVFVFACPTCRQMFQRSLPEIEGVFLYELMQQRGISAREGGSGEMVSVFDPCASRDEPGLQQSVRELAARAGYRHTTLPMEGRVAQCCSWGGQVSTTNARYAEKVVRARVEESEHSYVAYCANCRDIFAAAGKPVYHILDLLFGLGSANRPAPTLTERRTNRVRLKQMALAEFWDQEVAMAEPENKVILHISPELRQRLSADMILETDVEAVVAHCEGSGKKMLDPGSGRLIGHLQIGRVTYWVEYTAAEGGFELLNAYSHRMTIGEG